jgi:hypothetical protein
MTAINIGAENLVGDAVLAGIDDFRAGRRLGNLRQMPRFNWITKHNSHAPRPSKTPSKKIAQRRFPSTAQIDACCPKFTTSQSLVDQPNNAWHGKMPDGWCGWLGQRLGDDRIDQHARSANV